MVMELLLIVLTYLVFINAAGLYLMGLDKKKAVMKERRISEKTFFSLAIAGAGPGIYAGMRTFRHKTLHKRFSLGIPMIMGLQVLVILEILINL
ncbi:protein of unknown function DUF1294 [Methanosalsum zhilinae DSM 4017]|uniref:DUF1294 domain-containing protein n=1 Tax=Methanosalsum zhilinae (strain DSM 4017 / NBRC 107636 / OCM 62 / WeN5) TaxID=679901 RepID=F7XNB9_METZD|nr:DUF1294 domain-containing protein [Methanosalsum zhilinae]AEH60080.1 protein of unknown function DUF1294 [Methanosalsum zhilinae DSM 4017]